MKTRALSLLLLVGVSLPAWAQDAGIALCHDDLAVDRQPAFNAPDGGLALGSVTVTPGGDLRLNTGLAPLNAEQIVLPFDQTLSVSFVAESAGASQTLGWIYYDDLIARGYVNTNGTPADSSDDTLIDADADGVPDFHADIFNVGHTRPYVGAARRCATTFVHGGKTYYRPEISMRTCVGYFASEGLANDLPPYTVGPHDVVGELAPGSPYTAPANEFSDNGLFPQVPNLLEPRHPSNNLMGLGHLIFLNGDDDPDNDSYAGGRQFTPALDVVAAAEDGIPDYNVTAYDSTGVPVLPPPDLVINGADRTVNLGVIPGNREIVFFILNYGDKAQEPTRAMPAGGPRVLPCLHEGGSGCALYLRTPVAVYFSKSSLNMDLNPLLASPAADRNIGCVVGSSCLATDGVTYPGWLELTAIGRLNTATYGNLALPMEHVSVPRPANNRMPHAIVGAPSTDPFRWILGFENVAGGGDRDFNDILFMIGKSSGGGVTSGVVSGDISPGIAPDFTITQIRFERVDDVTRGLPGPPDWYEVNPGACSVAPPPAIDYFLAVDCRVCLLGVCTPNPTPTWFPVVFPAATPNVAVINPVDLGFTGSQLCWRATFTSPNEFCQPTINDINVGYQAIRSGNYSRAAPSPIANAVLFGSEEFPGITWIGAPASPTPAPTTRPYDGKKDMSPRGHLKMETIYDPETPGTTTITLQWDAGGNFTLPAFNPAARRVLTTNGAGARIPLTDAFAATQLFPLPGSCLPSGAPHDLNADGLCNATDATFLTDWLYGWENRAAALKRAWPMGGLNFSTPAFVGPPSKADWMAFAPPVEQAAFQANFATPLIDRRAQTYVGTVSGVLHAFDSGLLRLKDDGCTTSPEYRGYFEHALPPPSCTLARDYGTGAEDFAYLPRLLLGRYVNNLTGFVAGVSGPRATFDASSTVTDVDFGSGGVLPAWTISAAPATGAKSVLVSSSGKNSPVVSALDVTNDPAAVAGTYPIPMWEVDLGVVANTFNLAGPPPTAIDGQGSRHAPFIGRFDVATSPTPVWLAVVVTDFVPTSLTAGTVYFIDLRTGQPFNLAALPAVVPAVVPLEVDEGLGGEPIPVDVDGNGAFDVVYVPSTSGKVWRVSLKEINLAAASGQEILRCPVADARQALEVSGPLEPAGTQRIFSNIGVKVTRGGAPKTTIFFGTADNPDDPTDPMSTQYYALSFDDAAPASGVCSPPILNWFKALDPNQRVWGGVTVTQDQIFVATAVGTAADACNLDTSISGLLYTINQTTAIAVAVSLGGHATSTPVIYDNHVFVARANGGPRVLGDDTHNNPMSGSTLPRSHVLMWDSPLDGKLPR